jgi:MYXO-CTERM domain-containing protein
MMITTHNPGGMTLATVLTAVCTSILLADIVEYRDKEEWEAAAGSWSTADFTGFPMGTPIDEQYAYLGVHFVDGYDFVVLGTSYPNDGAGLDGNELVDLVFDAPMYSIAADFPGFLGFDLYFEGEFFHKSSEFGASGVGNFGGLVSTEPFDRAVLWEYGTYPNVNLDDLHFGPPIPTPSVPALLGAALLAARRRRRQ